MESGMFCFSSSQSNDAERPFTTGHHRHEIIPRRVLHGVRAGSYYRPVRQNALTGRDGFPHGPVPDGRRPRRGRGHHSS
jgi:hypothetical protein